MRTIRQCALVVFAALLAGCTSSSGGDVQQTTDDNPPRQKLFTHSDYAFEPVPAPRSVGADNYRPKGSSIHGANEFHFSGKDCLRCHASGQKASAVPFTMAGTVYKDLLGSEPLAGAEVVLLDSTGKVISMTSNAAGNFMTQTEIADADPDPAVTSRTYKTWVLSADGKIIPMVTMTTMSCNMHHPPINRRGALWAGSWSAAPDAAADPTMPVSYTKHVAPILQAKCVPCHVPSPDSAKNLSEPLKKDPVTGVVPTYDYTAGFDLVQYDSIVKDDGTSKVAPWSGKPFLNFAQPGDSLLLAKMLGPETAHAGGKLAADKNDPDYQTLLRWIQQGAPGPVTH